MLEEKKNTINEDTQEIDTDVINEEVKEESVEEVEVATTENEDAIAEEILNEEVESTDTDETVEDDTGGVTPPTNHKKRNIFIIIVVIIAIILALLGLRGCSDEEDVTEEITLEQSTETLEYSLEGYDPLDYIEVVDDYDVIGDDYEITADPVKIDASELGDVEVEYTLSIETSDEIVVSSYTKTFTVEDTQAPIITLTEKTVSLAVGAEFDPTSVIENVEDVVDGELVYVEYIENDTTGTESDVDAITFNDTGYYTIESDVDTATVGEYSVIITAVDNHGNETEKTVNVAVSEDGTAVAEEDESTNDSGTNSTSSTTTSSNNSSSSKTSGSTSSSSSSNKTNSSTSSSSNTSSSSGSSSTNSGSSSSSSSSSGTTTTHTHSWVEQFTTQTSQKWVVDQSAYTTTEPVYETQTVYIYHCNGCGATFNTKSEADNHSSEMAYLYITTSSDPTGANGGHSYSCISGGTKQVQTGTTTVYHDEVGHYETVTTQVSTGYKCSTCGATK